MKVFRLISMGSLALLQSACIFWSGDIQPPLETAAVSAAGEGPRIQVIFDHTHTFGGKPVQPQQANVTHNQMSEALDRILLETPYLKNARKGTADPDYILQLATQNAEANNGTAMLSGLTLTVLPGIARTDMIAEATLKRPDGEVLENLSSRGSVRGVIQIALLPFMFVNAWTAPEPTYAEDVLRRIFAQLPAAIERHPVPPASPEPIGAVAAPAEEFVPGGGEIGADPAMR